MEPTPVRFADGSSDDRGDATVGKAAVVLAAAAGSRAAYAINAGLAHGTLPGANRERVRLST
jgi:hypothetical protein